MSRYSTQPAPVTRDSAQHAAHHVLQQSAYARYRPTTLQRLTADLLRYLGHALERLTAHLPGGAAGLILVFAAVFVAVVAVRIRLGPLHPDQVSGALDLVPARTAASYRCDADSHAAAGAFDLAIRDRMRAIARELEERGIVEPRPSRTAIELARAAGAALPEHAAALSDAAGTFGEVWYGSRPATAAADARIMAADDSLRAARIVVQA